MFYIPNLGNLLFNSGESVSVPLCVRNCSQCWVYSITQKRPTSLTLGTIHALGKGGNWTVNKND